MPSLRTNMAYARKALIEPVQDALVDAQAAAAAAQASADSVDAALDPVDERTTDARQFLNAY